MKTTIETLTLIRDHIRSKCLPTAQGKTEGKWGVEETFTTLWLGPLRKDGSGKISEIVTQFNIDSVVERRKLSESANASFIAAISDTAEPAWLCVAEEIDELLPTLRCNEHIPVGDTLTSYARMRAASIINNWKDVIK